MYSDDPLLAYNDIKEHNWRRLTDLKKREYSGTCLTSQALEQIYLVRIIKSNSIFCGNPFCHNCKSTDNKNLSFWNIKAFLP